MQTDLLNSLKRVRGNEIIRLALIWVKLLTDVCRKELRASTLFENRVMGARYADAYPDSNGHTHHSIFKVHAAVFREGKRVFARTSGSLSESQVLYDALVGFTFQLP